MPGVKFIDHEGERILLMDFAAITDMDLLSGLVEECIRSVHEMNTPHSVLCLLDLSGTPISTGLVSNLKRLSQNNGPYIKAMTFVGLNSMWRFIVSGLLRVTKRQNHKVFRTRRQAIEWLKEYGR